MIVYFVILGILGYLATGVGLFVGARRCLRPVAGRRCLRPALTQDFDDEMLMIFAIMFWPVFWIIAALGLFFWSLTWIVRKLS